MLQKTHSLTWMFPGNMGDKVETFFLPQASKAHGSTGAYCVRPNNRSLPVTVRVDFASPAQLDKFLKSKHHLSDLNTRATSLNVLYGGVQKASSSQFYEPIE